MKESGDSEIPECTVDGGRNGRSSSMVRRKWWVRVFSLIFGNGKGTVLWETKLGGHSSHRLLDHCQPTCQEHSGLTRLPINLNDRTVCVLCGWLSLRALPTWEDSGPPAADRSGLWELLESWELVLPGKKFGDLFKSFPNSWLFKGPYE